jgi:hypothetical protein
MTQSGHRECSAKCLLSNFYSNERRWLLLAESYEHSERLKRFLAQPRNLPQHPICPTCDIPMWMTKMNFVGAEIEYRYDCPACEERITVKRLTSGT